MIHKPEGFLGLRVVTYIGMSNHLLLEKPDEWARDGLDCETLFRGLPLLFDSGAVRPLIYCPCFWSLLLVPAFACPCCPCFCVLTLRIPSVPLRSDTHGWSPFRSWLQLVFFFHGLYTGRPGTACLTSIRTAPMIGTHKELNGGEDNGFAVVWSLTFDRKKKLAKASPKVILHP